MFFQPPMNIINFLNLFLRSIFPTLSWTWTASSRGWTRTPTASSPSKNSSSLVKRRVRLWSGLSIEGFSIRRCQVNSFLYFWFKKIHEPAKNPFYLVLLTQCILDKCVLFGMEFCAISWILFWPFFLVPIMRTLSEVKGWLLTPVPCYLLVYTL